MYETPETLPEFAANIAELASELGVNNKNLSIILPEMKAHAITKMVKQKKVAPEHGIVVMLAHDILVEAKQRRVLPISPKTAIPSVLKVFADMIVAETRYEIAVDQFDEPNTEEETELHIYEAMSAQAQVLIDEIIVRENAKMEGADSGIDNATE